MKEIQINTSDKLKHVINVDVCVKVNVLFLFNEKGVPVFSCKRYNKYKIQNSSAPLKYLSIGALLRVTFATLCRA